MAMRLVSHTAWPSFPFFCCLPQASVRSVVIPYAAAVAQGSALRVHLLGAVSHPRCAGGNHFLGCDVHHRHCWSLIVFFHCSFIDWLDIH